MPVFGDGEQVLHKMISPVLYIYKPILSLATTAMTTLQATLKIFESVMQGHIAKPDKSVASRGSWCLTSVATMLCD